MRLLLLAAMAVVASGQTIQVTSGAAPYQVFQRGFNGKADIKISGTATDADGKQVEARLLRGIVPIFGLTWKKYGAIANGKWEATLASVPTGGPYKLEVRVEGTKNTTQVESLLVGDLWVLAGQSNMEGVGNLEFVQAPDDKVHTIDMVNERWQIAEEPLHNIPGAVDRVHWPLNAEKQPVRYTDAKLDEYNRNRKKGAGLGIPFGIAYVKGTDIPVGLIPCAHGGTSMNQWDPAKYDPASPGDSLYGAMIRRVNLASPGGRVKGVLWYQGESETTPTLAPLFQDKFEKFIARVRQDFNDPSLPFYYVQIGRYAQHQNPDSWNQIQELQRTIENTVGNTAVFASVDSELDDVIHVGTTDLKRIGTNMGKFAAVKAKRGPRLASITLKDNVIKVNFVESNGKLTSEGRLTGFTIHAPTGEVLPLIYKQQVDPHDPQSVLLHLTGKLPEGAMLRYGAGKDPYVNLRDEAGFGVLAFGPLPVK